MAPDMVLQDLNTGTLGRTGPLAIPLRIVNNALFKAPGALYLTNNAIMAIMDLSQ